MNLQDNVIWGEICQNICIYILLIKSPPIFLMYHGDSPIYYTYKFRVVLKIFPGLKGLGGICPEHTGQVEPFGLGGIVGGSLSRRDQMGDQGRE